jgi:hypothetical protein
VRLGFDGFELDSNRFELRHHAHQPDVAVYAETVTWMAGLDERASGPS